MVQLTQRQVTRLVGMIKASVESNMSRSEHVETDNMAIWDAIHSLQNELLAWGTCTVSLGHAAENAAIAREMYEEHAAEHTSGYWLDN